MNPKALLVLVTFLAGGGYSLWWLNQKKATCCVASPPTPSSTPVVESPKAKPPLYFNWSSDEPKQGDGFASFKKVQVANLGPSDTLAITAWYYSNETNGEAIARQRGENLKSVFGDVAGNRIKVIVEKRGATNDLTKADFEAASFAIITNQNSLVKKSGNNILIYFASNASAKKLEKEVDDYLTTLSTDMKANPAVVVNATGYTDNVGNDARNLQLSESRANFVKSALVAKGIDAKRIVADGKGKENPIATNDTEEGRRLNRRVELTITN